MRTALFKISIVFFAVALVYAAGFSMRHGDDAYHPECASLAGLDCTFGANSIAAVTTHLNILKNVSAGVVSYFTLILSLFTLAFLAIFADSHPEAKNFGGWAFENIRVFARKKDLGWLSLQEKRDPYSA